mmetsp:Transcript_70515/g.136082  ORF Transcript_70515/g.136082 Transcript_70515/m.136082 type:complete len:171 (+) Transcript_70515:74-586(+)
MMRAVCTTMAACLLAHATWCFVGPSTPSLLHKAPSSAASGSIISPASDASGQTPSLSAWNPLAFGVALGLLAAVAAGSRPVLAADLENGEAIFNGNCTACHAGGNNSVLAEKKIKKPELEKYLTGGYNVAAIKTQVTNGKNSMPAFGDKLGPDDIDDVANWVYNQADKWD